MRDIINIMERVQDQNIWFNARTDDSLKVREGALTQTVSQARERFGFDDDFANRTWTEETLTATLMARAWVHIEVMAGATIIRGATLAYAKKALHNHYLHVPLRHVMLEVGLGEVTKRVEFQGEEQVKEFLRTA